MKRAKKKVPVHRNSFVTAMYKRHPRAQVMRHKSARRPKDTRNHWSKEEVS